MKAENKKNFNKTQQEIQTNIFDFAKDLEAKGKTSVLQDLYDVLPKFIRQKAIPRSALTSI